MGLDLNESGISYAIKDDVKFIMVPCECGETINVATALSELIFVECYNCKRAHMIATDHTGDVAEAWVRLYSTVVCNVAESIHIRR